MKEEPTIAGVIAMPVHSDFIALDFHDVLIAPVVLASITEVDGKWNVRVRRGPEGHGFSFPADDDREEFLAVLADQLEAAAGVRPEVAVKD